MADGDNSGMHGPTPILDRIKAFASALLHKAPDADLKREVAQPELAGVRAMWDQSVAAGLTPQRLASILQNAKRGDMAPFLELAEEMEERDPHYFSVLGTRKRALSRLKPSVEGKDKIAEAVRDLVKEPAFRDMLRDLTDAFGKGFAAVEIVWRAEAGMWKPAYVWRDQKFFTFDYISRSELRLARDGTLDGEALEPAKWIVHFPKLKSGIPIRGGFARIAAWAFLFKNVALKDWVSYLDVYGMPIRVGKYHPSATPDERRKLLQAVMQIASDAAAIIPESMLIEFLEAKGGGGGGSIPFERIGRYLDEQLSKAILGQTMTSDNGSSEAQAKIHNQIRIDILEDDADQLGVTINRDLIAPFVAWNFGANAKAPIVVFPVAEPEDVQVMAEALKKLVPLGLKVAMSEVREKIGFSEPEEEDELLAAPAPAPIGHNGGPLDEEEEEPPPKHKSALNAFGLRGCPCCGTTERRSFALNAQDEAGAIGAEEDADWEPQLEPIVTAVIKAAEETSSYEEFAAQLAKLAGNIDAELLVRRIAIAQMKARGAGDGGDVRR